MTGRSAEKGRRFEDEIAALYRFLGYTVQRNIEIVHKKVDILASYRLPGMRQEHRIIVECKDEDKNRAQNQRVMEFEALLGMARKLGLADSAEIITRKPWSDQAKGFASSAGIGLYTFQEKLREVIDFSTYVERVIYDYEHYDEYVDDKGYIIRTPIIDIMSRSDLYKTYIPLTCRVLDQQNEVHLVSLNEYVEKWLADSSCNHLSILGDFGTGKSSFALHFTYELAKQYSKDPIKSRIPLFISLRDYAKADDLQVLITDLLINKYDIRIGNYSIFQRFLEQGNLILVFDGFDEMATKTDRTLTIRHFEELTKVVVASSKTILTCRTNYFLDQRHMDDILRSDGGNLLLQAVRRRPSFQIVELEEFSDRQIQELLSRHSPNDWQDTWIIIRRNLYDLARRPLLLDMILKSQSYVQAIGHKIKTAHLYGAYTHLWIEREGWHAKMTPQGKQAFMEDLAMRMWTSGVHSIHYRDLTGPIQDYFKDQIITSEELDYFDHDVRTCSFLNRDPSGNYQFIHNSFMEFFVAKRVFSSLSTNTIDPSFRKKSFSPEICNFIAQLSSEDVEALANLCTWAFDEAYIVAWNAISVLPFLKSFEPQAVVNNLTRLCEKGRLKSGIAWVLGEMGIVNEGVLTLLQNALNNPGNRGAWWEAAFALNKLKKTDDPVGLLIENLPSEWAFGKAIAHLKGVGHATDSSGASIDQRAIVAVIKKYREADKSRHKIRGTIASLFSQLNLSTDILDRRAYYVVWLLGELRISSMLTQLLGVVNHPQAPVRNMLAEALGKIGEVQGVRGSFCIKSDVLDVLKQLLRDHYYRTRLHAAESIGRIRAGALLSDLKDAMESESLADVQDEISKAIQKLHGSTSEYKTL